MPEVKERAAAPKAEAPKTEAPKSKLEETPEYLTEQTRREAQAAALTGEAQEAPAGAKPGSHPLCPIESDPEALAAYQRGEYDPKEALWHLDSSNKPVCYKG